MRSLSGRAYHAAVAAIDRANAADPNTVHVRGSDQPLALVHGQYAAAWVAHLDPGAPEAVLLAARAHHLRRWEVARGDYPDGRAGYLRWRKDQKARHAVDVAALLTAAGYASDTTARVQELIRRDHLATDPGAQAVEDAACLVFLETQLSVLHDRLEHERMLEVIRKTARKMSPAGLAAVSRIELGDVERALLAEAL